MFGIISFSHVCEICDLLMLETGWMYQGKEELEGEKEGAGDENREIDDWFLFSFNE